MIYVMAPPKQIYPPLERKRAYPLVEALVANPESDVRISFPGSSRDSACITLLDVLEELLSNPPVSDKVGAARVLDAAKSSLIGVEDKSEHADLPLIARYCKVHQDGLPLTSLSLLAYGHSKTWTHAKVSQRIYPLYESILEKLERTPAMAKAVVEFVAADYDLNEWMPDQSARSLPRIARASAIVRQAAEFSGDDLSEVRARLQGVINEFIKKSGCLAGKLLDASHSAVNKMYDLNGQPVNAKEFEHCELLADMIKDNAELVWPFAAKISVGDLLFQIKEFFCINDGSRQHNRYTCSAFDDVQTCTWVLSSLAGQGNKLFECSRTSSSSSMTDAEVPELLEHFFQKVSESRMDELLITRAKANLSACLMNWIANRNHRELNIDLLLQNEILKPVFEAGHVQSCDSMLTDGGRRVLTSYVMSVHTALNGQLTRRDRGRQLEDDLGM